mmetsp:Transcript_16184/g.17969  ORF Transcript_16184/g.17969 Transcript_16184/m.17969 type:complete len:115 (+) Transcript_16184:379-723(+)
MREDAQNFHNPNKVNKQDQKPRQMEIAGERNPNANNRQNLAPPDQQIKGPQEEASSEFESESEEDESQDISHTNNMRPSQYQQQPVPAQNPRVGGAATAQMLLGQNRQQLRSRD